MLLFLLCMCVNVKNKGADQPVHLHSLSSTFVIFLSGKYTIQSCYMTFFSVFYIVSVAEKVGLSLTLLQIPEIMFSCNVDQIMSPFLRGCVHLYSFLSFCLLLLIMLVCIISHYQVALRSFEQFLS